MHILRGDYLKMSPIYLNRKRKFYERYIKRLLDIACSLLALIMFSWLYCLIAIVVYFKMGTPILFKQHRPGKIDAKTGQEKIFIMYKFRTMTNEMDENGRLLSDEERLSKFGRILRATSLDELPEAINILKGDMSVIGPRPQLVRDLVFMSDEQRMRHIVKPGLSGLAQTKGRNAINWEEKINWDLKYIETLSFFVDAKLVWKTFIKVFFNARTLEASKETDVVMDYGEELLKAGKISCSQYETLQTCAKNMIVEFETKRR